jgi:hypothetical protein
MMGPLAVVQYTHHNPFVRRLRASGLFWLAFLDGMKLACNRAELRVLAISSLDVKRQLHECDSLMKVGSRLVLPLRARSRNGSPRPPHTLP